MAQTLPAELWLEVFGWATYNSLLDVAQSHSPFQPDPLVGAKILQVDLNFNVRLTFSLVCRQWRQWVLRSLFTDINIKNPSSASDLREALERPAIVDGYYGEMVRRVVLQYNSTVPGPCSQPMQSVEVLKLCPYIHTLLRPLVVADELHFDYESDGVPLPALRHLEWWHYNNEAERSGGINSLSAVLHGAPNITYLFVGGLHPRSNFNRPRLQKENLPHLQTLRLNSISVLFLQQMVSQWSLPSLTYIILDSPLPGFGWGSVWNAFGRQLKAIEFGKNAGFFVDNLLSYCLDGCPGLEELNFHPCFTSPAENVQFHTSLTTVRLHVAVKVVISGDWAGWNLIERHFEVLCGSNLPALRCIILYGDWEPVLLHPRFASIRAKLQDTARVLEISH